MQGVSSGCWRRIERKPWSRVSEAGWASADGSGIAYDGCVSALKVRGVSDEMEDVKRIGACMNLLEGIGYVPEFLLRSLPGLCQQRFVVRVGVIMGDELHAC
jgi:hypothetical protein